MTIDLAQAASIGQGVHPRNRRFGRVVISCVFGNPRDRRTWSGAPMNIAAALENLGIEVQTISPRIHRIEKLALAARYMLEGHGGVATTEQLLRTATARHRHAQQVTASATRLGAEHVLHMGTLDMCPDMTEAKQRHYIYCDQTWALSLAHRPDVWRYSAKTQKCFESLERAAFARASHIFTFGNYVRENLIGHYGIASDRVTTVGSGMGSVEPYYGPKEYGKKLLLFVAKHLFIEKGGKLLLDAYRIARIRHPDLQLVIVGPERARQMIPPDPRIEFRTDLPWFALQNLYRDATLLVQPMLNDPWGQVYLEALISRTPVIGLRRNGLPEIVQGGRYGFLVDRADPKDLADTIVLALSHEARLSAMGAGGQQHVLSSYSWSKVAERIAAS